LDIEIYTDGSCHTQKLVGAWVAIILVNEEKTIISGVEQNTTHQRMELTAVIHAISHVQQHFGYEIAFTIVTDSQYVIGLIDRTEKLIAQNFTSKKGNETRNVDLVKTFYQLRKKSTISFQKIKAHLKESKLTPNFNNEADQIVKNLVRNDLK